jgi:hypothetical protein
MSDKARRLVIEPYRPPRGRAQRRCLVNINRGVSRNRTHTNISPMYTGLTSRAIQVTKALTNGKIKALTKVVPNRHGTRRIPCRRVLPTRSRPHMALSGRFEQARYMSAIGG